MPDEAYSTVSSSDYGDGLSIEGTAKKIIIVMIACIIIIGVFIPFLGSVMYPEVVNADPSDVRMDYIDMTSDGAGEDRYITVSVDGDSLAITGDYDLTTTDMDDQILVLSDSQCVYLSDGRLYYYDGATSTEKTTLLVPLTDGKLLGKTVSWVYYPADGGDYSSFQTIDHVLSDKVGFDISDNKILSDYKIVNINGKGVVMNVQTRNTA